MKDYQYIMSFRKIKNAREKKNYRLNNLAFLYMNTIETQETLDSHFSLFSFIIHRVDVSKKTLAIFS
jgi:hypothetical protein